MINNIQHNILLSSYTTLKVGGTAKCLVEVTSQEELKAALQYAHEHTEVPPLLIGGGSNILVRDEGYEGLVIVNKILGITYSDSGNHTHVQAGAGVVFDDLVAEVAKRGYWGLENLSAIPGSVGATPIQNVGAYGVEVSDVISSVRAVHQDSRETKDFTSAECQFGYRDSFFKTTEGRRWVVTHVTFMVVTQPKPTLSYKDLRHLEGETLTPEHISSEVRAIRSQKFPDWNVIGTAGSFFKNPIISTAAHSELLKKLPNVPSYPQSDNSVKVSLGWILDKACNLKGFSKGNVGLYENQALVLIAHAGATADEIQQFAFWVGEQVENTTGIKIEWEVTQI